MRRFFYGKELNTQCSTKIELVIIKKELEIMFKKYNSIENTYREKQIEQVYLHEYHKENYIVQEKVHGANFSFITDGETIEVAKRSGVIPKGENFNNYEYVLEKYTDAIKELFKLVKKEYPNTETVIVFGELFGGNYEHSEVKKVNGMVKIQKGVFYSPENDFYAFDICINQEEYIDVDISNTFFEKVGLFYAKTLFEGSFEESLKYSNEFNSKISAWLGLPLIEDNICEGVVIKPVKSKRFKNGSRVIFKNKNEKWSERTKVKSGIKSTKSIVSLSDKERVVVKNLLSYVNENRLMNVRSKLGDFTPKQTGKTIGLLSKDAFEDFRKDYESEWSIIEKDRQKLITKTLNREATILVKNVLLFV